MNDSFAKIVSKINSTTSFIVNSFHFKNASIHTGNVIQTMNAFVLFKGVHSALDAMDCMVHMNEFSVFSV